MHSRTKNRNFLSDKFAVMMLIYTYSIRRCSSHVLLFREFCDFVLNYEKFKNICKSVLIYLEGPLD